MKVGIHPDKGVNGSYSEKWAEYLRNRNIDVKYIDLTSSDWVSQIQDCDGIMWRWTHGHNDKIKAFKILHTIEYYLKIPIYPDHNTCWHFDDKISQHYILKSINAPIPETHIFWDKRKAIEWINQARFPMVFKLSSGAGSSNVFKVNSKKEAQNLITKMFEQGFMVNAKVSGVFSSKLRSSLSRIKQGGLYVLRGRYPNLSKESWQPEKGYVYFQEFASENSYDTRITVIGDRAFGFIRYNRDGDFRASGSGKIDYCKEKIGLEAVKIAFNISRALKSQSMAYDFLYLKGKFVISEISYTYIDEAVYQCPGHWKPDLNWVNGKIWPEEAQVEDFIEYIKRHKEQSK